MSKGIVNLCLFSRALFLLVAESIEMRTTSKKEVSSTNVSFVNNFFAGLHTLASVLLTSEAP